VRAVPLGERVYITSAKEETAETGDALGSSERRPSRCRTRPLS
jgi:hypothetical protein